MLPRQVPTIEGVLLPRTLSSNSVAVGTARDGISIQNYSGNHKLSKAHLPCLIHRAYYKNSIPFSLVQSPTANWLRSMSSQSRRLPRCANR